MIIIDNYIQDKKILDFLRNPEIWLYWNKVNELYAGKKVLMYQYGYEHPKNIWEIIANIIMEDSRLSIRNRYMNVIEYWHNALEIGADAAWHQDIDELLASENSEADPCYPEVTFLWYGQPEKITGGKLFINNEEDSTNPEMIKPIYNRLVVLNPKLYHKVSEVKTGWRWALAFSVWGNKEVYMSLPHTKK